MRLSMADRIAALVAAAVLAAAAAAVPAVAQQNGATAFGPASGVVHVKRVQAMDNNGFGRPLPAFSMLVPANWQTEGGVVWTPGNPCSTTGYNFAFEAHSPDRQFRVAVLPTVSWTANYGFPTSETPCPQADLRNTRDFLTWYAGQIAPKARVLDYRSRPDLAQPYAGSVGRFDLGSGSFYETAIDAGEILIAGPDEQGRDGRATILAATMHWHSHFPGMPSPGMGIPGTPDMGTVGGSAIMVFAAGAPAGQLDFEAVEMIRKSITPEPEWTRRISEHLAKLNADRRRTSANISGIISRSNAKISDIIHEGYRNRTAIRDRGQRETVEAIRGVETYVDPMNGGTVQLDHTYRHAWQLPDGSYVLSNDEFFQPFRDLGVNAQRLQVAQ